jgi:hypothetical protein
MLERQFERLACGMFVAISLPQGDLDVCAVRTLDVQGLEHRTAGRGACRIVGAARAREGDAIVVDHAVHLQGRLAMGSRGG